MWQTLAQDPVFMKDFQNAINKNNLQAKDVLQAAGNIYHELSKSVHGRKTPGEIAIYHQDWENLAEIISLIVLFRYCDVPFTYYNMNGVPDSPPA